MVVQKFVAACWTVAFTVGFVGLTTPANATIFVRASLEELTTANQVVVVGEVLESDSYWNASGTFILTDFQVKPVEVLQGAPGPGDITITLMGGTVGDLTTLIVGGAELIAGRSYVLFLSRGNLPGLPAVLTVRDHSQGVFDIVQTRDGLRAISQVRTPLLPDSAGVTEPPGGSRGLPLDSMLDSLRALGKSRRIR